MKKTVLVSSIVATIMAMLFVGCKVTSDQMVIIAQQSGLVSAVTWIGYDNPSPQVKNTMKEITKMISDNAKYVKGGKSYLEVIYPIVEEYINNYVVDQYKPLSKVGASSLLTGIDLMFVMYPQFNNSEELVLSIVESFCSGAVKGLSLSSDNPILQTVQRNTAVRSYNNM